MEHGLIPMTDWFINENSQLEVVSVWSSSPDCSTVIIFFWVAASNNSLPVSCFNLDQCEHTFLRLPDAASAPRI